MFFVYALSGTLVASVLACVPALHVYNVVGLLLALNMGAKSLIGSEALSALMLGLITGYAMLNAIPSIFLSVPEESTIFITLPGQKYLRQRRGGEAALLTGVGGLGGVVVLVLLTPLASTWGPIIHTTLQPHLHWILLSITLFMLMSEWPKGTDRAATRWGKLGQAWVSLIAGLITFFLAGLLGFVLTYREITPLESAYQNLTPAFVGLFAMPWLLNNLRSRAAIPPQQLASSVDANAPTMVRGVLTGSLGGLFAAFFPVVTGGIGGLIAGHATAQHDDRLFLISQGASKVVYYVGGFLLFFVPGLHLTRGGMAWMLSGVYTPCTPSAFYRAMTAVLLSGALSFLLLLPLTRMMIRLVERVNYRGLSAATLVLLLTLLILTTGVSGLLVAAVATGIGMIPMLWGTRRMNCMGVLLLPLTVNMAGWGGTVAKWLGLL